MKTCTCKTPNAPGAKFCTACGRRLHSSNAWLYILAPFAFIALIVVSGSALSLLTDSPKPAPKAATHAQIQPAPNPPAPTRKPTGKEVGAAWIRLAMCKQLQDGFTREDIDADAQLKNNDLSGLVIMGPSVNRLFVRQFLYDEASRKSLKKSGFKSVEFMRRDYSPVAEYDPVTDRLTLHN